MTNKPWGKCAWCKKPVKKTDGAVLEKGRVWHSGVCIYAWIEKQRADKLKTAGFMDISLKQAKAIRDHRVLGLRDYLVENVGQPCKAYNTGCFVCRNWMAWLTLVELFELNQGKPHKTKSP